MIIIPEKPETGMFCMSRKCRVVVYHQGDGREGAREALSCPCCKTLGVAVDLMPPDQGVRQ